MKKIVHVIQFKRTEDGPVEVGISIGEGGTIVDAEGKIVTEIWDCRAQFHEGSFTVDFQVSDR